MIQKKANHYQNPYLKDTENDRFIRFFEKEKTVVTLKYKESSKLGIFLSWFSFLINLNYKIQLLTSSIVQMFISKENQWNKISSGILCTIKDYTKKSYYLRFYNLIVKYFEYLLILTNKSFTDFKLKNFKSK